jgi:hypothetical protein
MNWDFLEPVEFKGAPTDDDKLLIKQRGAELAEAVRNWCSAKVSA